MNRPASRRTVLATAVAVAAGAVATPSAFAGEPARTSGAPAAPDRPGSSGKSGRPGKTESLVSLHSWSTYRDWCSGEAAGTRPENASRPSLVFDEPQGVTDYRDPHTKKTASWEYATWISPVHTPDVAGSEVILSWNAHTPPGTWIRVELQGTYTDGTRTPEYTMGIWTAGDGEDVPRRTSVDGQSDKKSTVYTDTLSVDDTSHGLRVASYQVRLTLYRTPGSDALPRVWRLSGMSSDVPDRYEVPASVPGPATGVELAVPRYSQEIHKGQYPEYDGGGEAWCSPTSSQMIIESWGRKPSPEDLAWVDPSYKDPQVCHAARYTYDYQYEGCGNWPFNAAYAATYHNMQAVITRLDTLTDLERLVAAGIPVITSQSFIESELDGAGYGTSGHLMTVIGFTEWGDVIANDPASKDDDAVRHVYDRRQWENIWLRTKRKDEKGQVKSGTGGVCYLYFPANPAPRQRRVLRELGIW